jgi:hypothetical protein
MILIGVLYLESLWEVQDAAAKSIGQITAETVQLVAST